MSENKFIKHLRGENTAKSVLEIKNQKTPTSFGNMPEGSTSNANDVYSDHRGDAAGVLKGTENWKLNGSVLIETSSVYGDGRDFTDSFDIDGNVLWVNATHTFATARRFAPNTKFVLKLCGHDLNTVVGDTIGFTLLVKFGTNNVISKVFNITEQAFDFCKEFVIDFGESNTSAIKVAAGSTMTVQLLCADPVASATIYNGMTVFTALQRRVDSETVSSDTLSLDEIEYDLTTHINDKNNPHEVTKAQVGLGNCDNTSDLDKPISTATQAALDGKVSTDGSSTMTGPLKMRATDDFKCAIAPYWDGVGFFKLNDNNSVTLMASIEYNSGFEPATTNTYNIGASARKWKNLYLAGKAYVATINNGADLSVPNKSGTLATMGDVELAARSGRMLTDQGVWYAKMYAATVPPAAEDGTNYADFSQVDSDNNPIIVIYTRTSGAWVQSETITPPADYDGYVPVTSKIWDISEQTGQQGGRVLWNHTSKEFTPYPTIISFENAALTGNSTVVMPNNPTDDNIPSKKYVDDAVAEAASQAGYHPDLFDWKWADHELDNMSWLRADTFSWQSGAVYEAAYNQLVEDLASSYTWQGWKVSDDPSIPWVHTKSFLVSVGETVYSDHELTTAVGVISAVGTDNITVSGITYTKTTYGFNHFYETIDGITIGGYVASNGRKICTSSAMIEKVEEIYDATGVAWYYVLDTENQQFKLPRTKFGFIGLRDTVGNYVPESLPNITGDTTLSANTGLFRNDASVNGAFYKGTQRNTGFTGANVTSYDIGFDASLSSSAYQNGAPVQQRATQMYLYFYVGEFTQTAIENTAGLNAEDFNDKADTDFGNTSMIDYVTSFQRPTAENNYTWYRKYKSGWVEQGGRFGGGSGVLSVTLPITMADTNYELAVFANISDGTYFGTGYKVSTSNINIWTTNYVGTMNRQTGSSWRVSGMAAS